MFGFKTRGLPSAEVQKSTGNRCPMYEEKEKANPPRPLSASQGSANGANNRE
jgi:hypothetical protein